MKKKIFSIMVMMFISGGVLGFFIGSKFQNQKNKTRMVHRRGEGKKQQNKRIAKHFTTSLKLTKAQQEKLNELIAKILKGQQELEIENGPRKAKLLKSFNTGLRNILDETQKQKFNKMRKKRESKLFPGKPVHGRGLRRQRNQNSKQ